MAGLGAGPGSLYEAVHSRRERDQPSAGRGRGLLLQDSSADASTILIVEDETVVSFFIRTLFEERGLQVAVGAEKEG